MTTSYRERRKPGAPLLKFTTKESFGTLADMRERAHNFVYVVDVDGFSFRRHLRDDGAPTRWEPLRRPSKPGSVSDAYEAAAKTHASATRRADLVHGATIDNRDAIIEAKRLRDAWQAALGKKELRGLDLDDRAEQDAYDALVEWVETHGLNYTEHDPRGVDNG